MSYLLCDFLEFDTDIWTNSVQLPQFTCTFLKESNFGFYTDENRTLHYIKKYKVYDLTTKKYDIVYGGDFLRMLSNSEILGAKEIESRYLIMIISPLAYQISSLIEYRCTDMCYHSILTQSDLKDGNIHILPNDMIVNCSALRKYYIESERLVHSNYGAKDIFIGSYIEYLFRTAVHTQIHYLLEESYDILILTLYKLDKARCYSAYKDVKYKILDTQKFQAIKAKIKLSRG